MRGRLICGGRCFHQHTQDRKPATPSPITPHHQQRKTKEQQTDDLHPVWRWGGELYAWINNESPCLGANQCMEGFTGMSCSRCKKGYYRFQRTCTKVGTAHV
jgi:hypothetical protein